MIIGATIVQVEVVGLRKRWNHSASAVNLRPGVTEVTLFGGGGNINFADTTVLRFGKFHTYN